MKTQTHDPSKPTLRRELRLFDVTVAGVGIILGAGIYALIGIAASDAGNATWLSFFFGSFVAMFTGLSYAELSSFSKGDAGEYDYCKKAFGKSLSWFVAILVIFTGVIAAATVSLGFAGYAFALFGTPFLVTALLLVLLMSLINFLGIRLSNRFNLLATGMEFLGLLIIILLGIPKWGSVDLTEMPHGMDGVFQASALVFFSFMGFETIVKLREETHNPDVTIPRALMLAILISSILYILVSISAVSLLPASQLSYSDSPLADAAAESLGHGAFILVAVIALFSTSNTVLLSLLTSSRMVYGMAKERSLPQALSHVHAKTRAPHVAVWTVMALAILFVVIGKIEVVANITNVILFITFILVNAAAIVLRYKIPGHRPFYIPFNIGKFPLPALLGIATSGVLLYFALVNLM